MGIGIWNLNIFVLVSIIIWLILFMYWIIRSRKRGILNEILGLIKLLFSGLILFAPAFFNFTLLTYKTTIIIQIISIIIITFGFIICILAREYLSLNWSGKVTIQEGHNLIKTGPYKKIRHPIYSGVLIMMIGSSIIIGNLFDFIWVIFCFFGLYRKSKQEETLLVKEFGEEYEHYKKESKMLVPYVL